MRPYEGLARIYDFLVAGVDFEEWVEHLEEILKRFHFSPRTILDLACGTGNLTLPLARRGYRVIGLDISPTMISVAREKASQSGLNVEFMVEDMRFFKLKNPVDLIICFHDGINYLPEYEDLERVFCQVNKNLTPGGFFLFDVNNIQWLSKTTSEPTTLITPEFTLRWQTRYHAQRSFWEIEVTILIKDDKENTRAFTETHREYYYTPEQIQQALKASQLTLLAAYNAFTFSPISAGSRRHFYVTQKRS